jgi:DNA-binding phage protein
LADARPSQQDLKMSRTVSHHDYLMKHLASPAEATAYLNAVAKDGDLKSMVKAIGNVVEAQEGVGALAKKAKMRSRRSQGLKRN